MTAISTARITTSESVQQFDLTPPALRDAPGQAPSLSIVRVAEDGSVPPANGVIVSPEGSLAGLRTVNTPSAAVLPHSTQKRC